LKLGPLAPWRKAALALIALAAVVAALSRHVLHWPLPALDEPPMLVAALALSVWALAAWLERAAALRALRVEAQGLREAALVFGARAEAWLVAGGSADELEAEGLRRGVVDRHSAIVAAVRAHLLGLDPSKDAVVEAMTHAGERQGRHGHALVLHLAVLQREALTAVQRRGFLGETRLLALDDALLRLTSSVPVVAKTSAPNLLLGGLTSAYAVLLLLVTSQRLALVGATSLAVAALVGFELLATRPIALADDPRPDALTAL